MPPPDGHPAEGQRGPREQNEHNSQITSSPDFQPSPSGIYRFEVVVHALDYREHGPEENDGNPQVTSPAELGDLQAQFHEDIRHAQRIEIQLLVWDINSAPVQGSNMSNGQLGSAVNPARLTFRVTLNTGFLFHPEPFGFTPVNTAAENDENTLFFRQQQHRLTGSAGSESFGGPYTRNETMEIVFEEFFSTLPVIDPHGI